MAFVKSLPEKDYYVSESAALNAFHRRSQFNVVDMATGWKVDLIIRKARPYSLEELRRRLSVRMLDVDVFVATPEDTILSKLEWASLSGGSERQMRDVVGVLEVKSGEVDRAYIERWAAELGLIELWHRVSSPPGAPTGR